MAQLTASLNLSISQFRKGTLLARRSAQSLGQSLAKIGAGFGKSMFMAIPNAAKSAAQLSLGAFKKIMTGGLYSIGFSIAQRLGNGIREAVAGSMREGMEKQTLTMSFDMLATDGATGAQIFDELEKDSLRTGRSINSLTGTVRRLMAMGVSTRDALDISDSLLDLAGASGMSSMELDLLGVALAQVKSKGKAMAEEVRGQIGERGIPILQALAEAAGETLEELDKRMSLGKVSSDELLNAVKNLTGPLARFRSGADVMATTFAGVLGRIGAEMSKFKRGIGEELIPLLQPALEASLARLQEMRVVAVGMVKDLIAAGQLLSEAGGLGYVIKSALMLGMKEAVNFLFAALTGTFQASGMILINLLKMVASLDFWKGLLHVFSGLGQQLAASLAQALAGILEKSRESMPKWLQKITPDPKELKMMGDLFRMGGNRDFEAAKGSFGKSTEQMAKDAAKDALTAFVDGVKATGKILSTDKEKEAVRGAMDLVKRMGEERRKREAAAVNPEIKAPAAAAEAAKTTGAVAAFQPGAFFSEIAALKGQTVEQALANESRRHTELLSAIEKNTKPPKTPRPPVKPPGELVFTN